MWEIQNEGILGADVGSAVSDVRYSLLQLAEFYGDCADKIRELDDKHLITSGDSVLRHAQWNLLVDVMKGENISWKTDTKEERLKAGLTQEQLAAKIGTKKTYISRIENGKADVQLSTLFRIFEGLGKRVSLTIL